MFNFLETVSARNCYVVNDSYHGKNHLFDKCYDEVMTFHISFQINRFKFRKHTMIYALKVSSFPCLLKIKQVQVKNFEVAASKLTFFAYNFSFGSERRWIDNFLQLLLITIFTKTLSI